MKTALSLKRKGLVRLVVVPKKSRIFITQAGRELLAAAPQSPATNHARLMPDEISASGERLEYHAGENAKDS